MRTSIRAEISGCMQQGLGPGREIRRPVRTRLQRRAAAAGDVPRSGVCHATARRNLAVCRAERPLRRPRRADLLIPADRLSNLPGHLRRPARRHRSPGEAAQIGRADPPRNDISRAPEPGFFYASRGCTEIRGQDAPCRGSEQQFDHTAGERGLDDGVEDVMGQSHPPGGK